MSVPTPTNILVFYAHVPSGAGDTTDRCGPFDDKTSAEEYARDVGGAGARVEPVQVLHYRRVEARQSKIRTLQAEIDRLRAEIAAVSGDQSVVDR